VTSAGFNPAKDLLCLHYDHAPDKDDGHSAAADRTILESVYGVAWIRKHVIPVSGAYGLNKKQFNSASDKVMNVTWNSRTGWLPAHKSWKQVVIRLFGRWAAVLKDGGDIWVKEGGQSDITAELVALVKAKMPKVDTTKRIHVVQHSNWNENQTTPKALAYTKAETDYIRIKDANRYLNKKGGDDAFVKAATGHHLFGPSWKAAFAYYDTKHRLDFSDTGELMHILGLGEMGIDDFRKRFLDAKSQE